MCWIGGPPGEGHLCPVFQESYRAALRDAAPCSLKVRDVPLRIEKHVKHFQNHCLGGFQIFFFFFRHVNDL